MAELNFAQVYEDFKEEVWRLTSRYVASSQDREDVFQEVFLKIHKALAGFRQEASLETWIYKITANTAINYIKKRNRYKLLKNTLQNLRLIQAEDSVLNEEELKFKPLEKLNPQQRMVLVLHDIEEKKLGEISQVLNIPVGTVKSNLFRAREIVKKELNKNDGI